MMDIDAIIAETADTLRGFDWMDGIPVIVEERGDPDSDTEQAIAQQRICVVVGEGGFKPTVQAPDEGAANSVIGAATVVVSVFEKPVINRIGGETATLKALSRRIGSSLAWCQADGMASPLLLRNITPISLFRVDGDSDAIITRDVEFTTTAEL